MSRLATTFGRLAAAGRKALIPYVTSGHPAPALTVPIMHALVAGGADAIELGVPFSDPMADGPVIQRANEHALALGVGMRGVLGFVREFRSRDDATPVVLMGYANPVERMGVERFLDEAAAASRSKVPASRDIRSAAPRAARRCACPCRRVPTG